MSFFDELYQDNARSSDGARMFSVTTGRVVQIFYFSICSSFL